MRRYDSIIQKKLCIELNSLSHNSSRGDLENLREAGRRRGGFATYGWSNTGAQLGRRSKRPC